MSKERKEFTVAKFTEEGDDYYCLMTFHPDGTTDRVMNVRNLNPKFTIEDIISRLSAAIETWFQKENEDHKLFKHYLAGR